MIRLIGYGMIVRENGRYLFLLAKDIFVICAALIKPNRNHES
jgi:hypothetical protein